MNSRDGVRVSAADAYLPIDQLPPNLTIRPDAQVAHVVLDGTRATGVRLLDDTTIGASLVVRYDKKLRWQELSFSALQVFHTGDERIRIVGV